MRPEPGRHRHVLVALLVLEVAINWLANLPTWLDFPSFAFGDLGASLTIHDLVTRGLRPGVDFSDHYGLLPILFGRAWFGLLGRSPMAYYVAMGLIEAWMAWSLAAIVGVKRPGPAGSLILIVGLPFFIQSCYPNLAHALEAGLLCRALLEQTRGRRGIALALASMAVLAKPSLGLAHGLVLLVAMAASVRASGESWRTWLGRGGLGPALATGAVVLPLLAFAYGTESLVRTALPLAGMATYKAGGFGFFFGTGRDFWRPPGAGPGYYLGTVAGFWIIGSLILTVAGLVAVRRRCKDPADELIATCAAVHALFVFELFGHSQTWVYDSYVLGLGLTLLPTKGVAWTRTTWLLIVLAVPGLRTPLTAPWIGWRSHVRSAETLGLWADPIDRAEWIKVRALVVGNRAVLLATSGCLELLDPGLFEPAESVFLVAGLEDAPDAIRQARRVKDAGFVVVPKYLDNQRLEHWPRFQAALAGKDLVLDGSRYRVHRSPGMVENGGDSSPSQNRPDLLGSPVTGWD